MTVTRNDAAPLPQAAQAGAMDLLWVSLVAKNRYHQLMKAFRKAEEMVSCQLRVPLTKVCALHKTCPAAQLCWAAEEPIKGPLNVVSVTSVVSVPSD